MTTPNATIPNAYDPAALAETIDNMTNGLERVLASLVSLRALLLHETPMDTTELDPKDPANKYAIGGLMKLTPQGIEICYRLFDAGKSRYAVATLMGISFGAATHRLDAWKKSGGVNRVKQPLE